MRATHLLAALLFLSLAACVAFAGDQSQKDSSKSASPLNLSTTPSQALAIEKYRLPDHSTVGWMEAIRNFAPRGSRLDAAPVCYTMRTYRVRRVDPQSDVTEAAGYTDCQPDLKYSIRDTDEAPAP